MAAEEEAALHLLCGLNVEVIALHDGSCPTKHRRKKCTAKNIEVDAQNKRLSAGLRKAKKSSDIDSPTNGGRLRVLPSGATRAAGCL
jgi:hypothetical protein